MCWIWHAEWKGENCFSSLFCIKGKASDNIKFDCLNYVQIEVTVFDPKIKLCNLAIGRTLTPCTLFYLQRVESICKRRSCSWNNITESNFSISLNVEKFISMAAMRTNNIWYEGLNLLFLEHNWMVKNLVLCLFLLLSFVVIIVADCDESMKREFTVL